MNEPHQRWTSGPSPQWSGSSLQVRVILSFGIIPLLRPGGRNKRVQKTILLDELRGRRQVGSPSSSSSFYYFSSFFLKLMRLICHVEAASQSSWSLGPRLCQQNSVTSWLKDGKPLCPSKLERKRSFPLAARIRIITSLSRSKRTLVSTYSWTLASLSLLSKLTQPLLLEVRPVLKFCTLFSLYVASHSPKHFAWFQGLFVCFRLILKAALREVLKGSHLPKMAQLVCLSKTGTPSIWEFWVQSVCLWLLCHNVS